MAMPQGLELPSQAPELMPAKAFISGVDQKEGHLSHRNIKRSLKTSWSYL